MDDLLSQQFERVLDALPTGSAWPQLNESGFLDLLRPEGEGGAGADLAALFPLALAIGRRVDPLPVIQTMLVRHVTPGATDVADAEVGLVAGGVRPITARALAAAALAVQMTGAMERILQIVLDYAETRRQFGREIGRFQAIQQQIAVAAEEVMAARMAAQLACRGAPLDICEEGAGIAKARVGQAATRVGPIAHAVLGAIGMTAEHELHHHTRALQQGRLRHGGETWWIRKVGGFVIASAKDYVSLAGSL